MTDERTLTEWLHRDAPAPPRELEFDDLARRVRQETRRVPLVVAACLVVLVVAAATIVLARVHGGTGPAVRPTSTSAVDTTTPHTAAPHTTAPPAPLGAHPWAAQLVGTAALGDNSLVAIGGSIYGVTPAVAPVIVRVDPGSGATTARSEPVGSEVAGLGGALWALAPDYGASVVLRRYDTALRRTVSVAIAVRGFDGSVLPTLAADRSRSRLYLGAGRSVVAFDAATMRVTRRFEVADDVTAIAITPDGTTLYVGYGGTGGGGATLAALDAMTGAVRENYAGAARVVDLAASDRGVFATRSFGGHTEQVDFIPFGDEIRAHRLAGGGGGSPLNTRVSGGVAWVGGSQRLVCADLATGQIRARTPVGATVSFTAITLVGRTVYAVYDDGLRHALVVLHPPAACAPR